MKIFLLLFLFTHSVCAITYDEFKRHFPDAQHSDVSDIKFLYGQDRFEYLLSTLRKGKGYRDKTMVKSRVDLRKQMTPVKDQMRRGACCVFATLALYEAFLKKFFPHEPCILSEQAYLSLSKKDGNSSLPIRELIRTYGFIWDSPKLPYQGEDKDHPNYRSDATRRLVKSLPSKEYIVETNMGVTHIGCAIEEDNKIIIDLSTIFILLSCFETPLVASIHACSQDWGSGNIKLFPSKSYIAKEGSWGNHTILITGYDLDKELIFFKNSWGTDWGDQGYGTITFAAFAAQCMGVNDTVNKELMALCVPNAKNFLKKTE